MNNRKTPIIRFKGFTDDWEQRKLGEILSFLKDGTHGTHSDVDDGPLLLSAKNIKDGTIKWDETDRRIPQEEYEKIHSNFSLKTGDILLTIVGSIGETSILKDSEGLTFQRSVAFLRPKEDILSGFLYTEIQTLTFQKELESRKSTSAQSGIYLGDLAEIPVKYSPSLDEQKAIGGFLLHLDHLITLHQRKLEKLKIVKKAMLENCFPKNGEKVPKFRFSGFTGDWEQRKLLDCIRKITDFRGRTPKKLGMDWSESGYLALSALNVKDGYIDFSQDVHYGDEALYDMWMSGNELHEGQVLFTTEAPMGNVAQVPDNKRYILSQRTMAFDVKEDIITENFLAILLRSTVVFNTLTSLSSGGTAKGVSQKSLAGVDVQIPTNLNEQTLLADYFRHLDHLITLHQRKLEKLTIIKKSFLEKMFV